MVSRADILDTAKTYVTKDRAATHGDAEDNFSMIAGHWTWWLQDKLKPGEKLDAYDVANMMVGFKQARMKSNPEHVDSAQDLCGYGAIAGEIATERVGAGAEAFRLARQVDSEDEEMGFYGASQRL